MPASNRAKRALLLVRELGAGGSERQLVELAKAINRDRFDVRVGYFRDGFRREELENAGLPLVSIPVTSFRKPEALREAQRLYAYLRANQIAVVHTFDYPLTCFAIPVAAVAGVPVVLSSQRSRRELIPPVYRQAVRATDLMVNGVVVNCKALEQHLTQEEEVPQRKVHLCYNGIDTQQFTRAQPRHIRAERTVTFGCVAVLRPEKNLGLLVRAFANLNRTYRQTKLLITGGGPEEYALRQLIKDCGIENACALRHAQQDVRAALAEIDVFVLPSLSEAFSNSLMEAMASECAVVASDTGGNPELVRHERTGLLFRSGDRAALESQMERLVDPELRQYLATAARAEILGQFSIGRAAQCMETIYNNFLSEAGF